MASAKAYFDTVNEVQGDLDTLSDLSGDIGTAATLATEVLELPGDLEAKLREKADLVDLPNSIVTLLGALPFGIGTAIKQLDNIANSVSGTIDAQADVLGALDDAWAPARNAVDQIDSANDTAGGIIDGLSAENQPRVAEAALIFDAMGSESFYNDTALAGRMGQYQFLADGWFTIRDGALAPLQAAISGINSAITAIDNAVPDLSAVTKALDDALGVFNGAKSVANSIRDAIDISIKIPPFGPTINILNVLETITSWIDLVVGFVEDFVIDVFANLGININSVFNSIASEMLGFLNPFFDIFDTLQAVTAPLLGQLEGVMNSALNQLNALISSVDAVVEPGGLFDNIIEGDAADNDIAGTNMEDAIFGKAGEDMINGGFGSDFLFGGADGDTIIGGFGNDEMFGGSGGDVILGIFGNNYYDGGLGDDILLAQDGDDTLNGGAGSRDFLIGGGGADDFLFLAGNETDIIFDFEDNIDDLLIDASLMAGATDAQDFLNREAFDIGGNTIISLTGDVIILLGISTTELVDDIQFV
ncbi:hypothetical protein ACMU_05980 [Actibacterium mucosum KCTC 23349]|uniref:Calcium-binding protein n=1 Tax=Actibacterium mucosum KCTC 23349 TaxID=1454373 RepID=A0A037ZLH7_9RHOB|nr:hypothetical protein [Actibacterium mucosum]KAJ56489.1 hypothetical protein ACMU_05980 [Actibacterium mucosum KCTC 23349]